MGTTVFVAATALLTKEKKVDPAWAKIKTTTLIEFVTDVYENVKGLGLKSRWLTSAASG